MEAPIPLSSPAKLAYSRRYYMDHREMIRQHALEKHGIVDTGSSLLACCGLWQPITTVPHTCRRCGQAYLEESENESAE